MNYLNTLQSQNKKFLTYFLFSIFILVLSSNGYAEGYFWFSKSGIWESQTLKSGNKVAKQTFNFDRKKGRSPTPYLQFRTLKLHNGKKMKYLEGVTKVQLQFNVDEFYSRDKKGEAAVFLTGENEKSLYYIEFLYDNKNFYKVALFRSEIKDPSRPMRAFGNFRVKELVSSKIQIPTLNPKTIIVKILKNGTQVFVNGDQVLEFLNSAKTSWVHFPKNYFAVGARGAHVWIDDIQIYGTKEDKESILYQDNFDKFKSKRFGFKKK